ncbi:MAG: M3 family metallopeptidase [Candidatus Stygibacter australis]|nr:M3 family metallopeptidase [Candidatus Stygibacter australis]MDP8320905.1 M3 family metallopeptidase [Candidatus Stygibacter australis]
MVNIFKVKEIAKELADISTEYSRKNWVKYTTGYDFGINEVYKKMLEVLKDKDKYKVILEHLEKELNADDRRRVELLAKRFKNYHLSPELNKLSEQMQQKTTELSQILNTHRNKLRGREITSIEIAQIVQQSDDEELRKEAFLSRTAVNKPLVEGGFIELLNMRKEYAQLYGADNYVDYSLEQRELDPAIFQSWQKELKEQLPQIKKAQSEFARKYLRKSELMPWDGAYLSGKIAPELKKEVDMAGFYEPIRQLYARFGIDISEDNTTYDVFPRKNKSEWGYNFPIQRGVESRILANVKNRYSNFGVLLHETGHAMHHARLDVDDVLMNYGVSGIISEGIANLFGGFLYEEIFYKDFFADDIENAGNHLGAIKKWQEMNRMTAIENILFDQALYLNPISSIDDIKELKWKMYSELLGKKPYAEEPLWGFLIHHTTHPIYLHNYLMGDVTGAMLKQVFCEQQQIDSILEKPKEFGRFIIDQVIKPSGRYPYAELFKLISGKDFSLGYLKV